MTLLAGFQVLLAHWSGQQDVVVGTDIANRTSVESEGLIGFFVNLLVLRSDLRGSPLFSELLGQVRGMVLGAYSHQDLPFEMLVEQLRLSRQGNQVPLVRVLFVLQNVPTGQKDLAGVRLESVGNQVTTAKFDLALFVVEGAEELRVGVNYSSDLFEEQTIHTLCERFVVVLKSIVEQPDTPIEELEIHTPEEKTQQALGETELLAANRQELKMSRGEEIDLSGLDI
jgi:non-ribosomal peptide synthetase component F